EGVAGLEQGGDGDVVAWFRTARKLVRDFDRQRTAREEDVDRLTVERAANRRRGAGSHPFADQVVPELEAITTLGEDAGVQELPHGIHQRGDRERAHRREVAKGEASAEGSGEGSGPRR